MTASAELTKRVVAFVEVDGCLPESDDETNDLSRQVIAEMHQQHGECWLGRVNLYKGHDQTIMRKYNPTEPVGNFSCSFVIPKYDAELEGLIRERSITPYTSTADDSVLVGNIFNRLSAIGGRSVFWT